MRLLILLLLLLTINIYAKDCVDEPLTLRKLCLKFEREDSSHNIRDFFRTSKPYSCQSFDEMSTWRDDYVRFKFSLINGLVFNEGVSKQQIYSLTKNESSSLFRLQTSKSETHIKLDINLNLLVKENQGDMVLYRICSEVDEIEFLENTKNKIWLSSIYNSRDNSLYSMLENGTIEGCSLIKKMNKVSSRILSKNTDENGSRKQVIKESYLREEFNLITNKRKAAFIGPFLKYVKWSEVLKHNKEGIESKNLKIIKKINLNTSKTPTDAKVIEEIESQLRASILRGECFEIE